MSKTGRVGTYHLHGGAIDIVVRVHKPGKGRIHPELVKWLKRVEFGKLRWIKDHRKGFEVALWIPPPPPQLEERANGGGA